MTFSAQHYVPFLKAKRGEKKALAELSPAVRARVTPLLEIVERTEKAIEPHLDTAFAGLPEAARLFDRCFIDAHEIERDGPRAAEEVFRRASSTGMAFTPVTGVSRTSDVAAALQYQSHGLALRLRRQEFEAGGLGGRLDQFITRHGLARGNTDLIIDLGAVDDFVIAGVQALTLAFLAEIPDPESWKTLVLSACAFPPSMTVVERNSHGFVERSEWLAWRDGRHAERWGFTRIPTYSDAAIQHPMGVEGFDPRIMQVSASIRYTVSEKWLLIKGEGTRLNPAREQFPQLATQVVYGHLRQHYYGQNHCQGCADMKRAADGAPRLGSAEVWRRLGTIHHITTVVEELEASP